MLEGMLLFFVGIGALLVSIVSILRLAWLAVIIPLLIAIGAAYALYALSDRRPLRTHRSAVRRHTASEKSGRMAA